MYKKIMQQKNKSRIRIQLILFLASLLILSSCAQTRISANNSENDGEIHNDAELDNESGSDGSLDIGNIEKTPAILSLSNEEIIEENDCKNRGINDKILVMHSKYCGHCAQIVPELEELARNSDKTFEFYDLADSQSNKKMQAYYLSPRYTPTVIVDCEVLIGSKDLDVYKKKINKRFGGEV